MSQLIYGFHAIKALLNQPNRIQKIFVQQGRDDQRMQAVLEKAGNQGIEIIRKHKKALDQMVDNVNHQGVVAEYTASKILNEADLKDLMTHLDMPAFLLVLDGVQDPHNLGACLRTANAAGIHAVIAPKDRAVGLTPLVRKIASGAAEFTPFIQVTNLARSLRYLKEQGVWLYGTSDQAEGSLFQATLTGALAWVMGGEGKGLRRLTAECCDEMVSIPMQGTVPSLNVSVATAVCLYESQRQRSVLK